MGERVTVVQLARFGDLIQTSPMLQRLIDSRKGEVELHLIVEKRTVDAANMLSGVTAVHGVDLNHAASIAKETGPNAFKKLEKALLDQLPRETSDEVILLNKGAIPEAIAALLPAKHRMGPGRGSSFDAPHRLLVQLLSNRSMNPMHLSEIWGGYARSDHPLPKPALSIQGVGTTLAKYTSSRNLTDRKNKCYAINIGAGSAGRKLAGAKLAAAAENLLENDRNCLLLLGKTEDTTEARHLLDNLPNAKRNNVLDLTGRTSLRELADVLSDVDVLISSDTGTLQLSAATGTKSVGLFFGGANPVETGAWMDGAVAIVDKRSLTHGDLIENLALLWASEIARNLAEECRAEEWKYESSTCDMLVARPAPVGLIYTPEIGDGSVVGRGRQWRDYLEFILTGSSASDPENSTAEKWNDPSSVERSQRLLTLLQDMIERRGAADPSWTEEELWLARIVGAFPEESRQWALMTTKQAARGRIEA